MAAALIAVAVGIGIAIGVVYGKEPFIAYVLTLPVCFTILWLSRDVETFSDRV